MGLAMQAAARHELRFVILDRPIRRWDRRSGVIQRASNPSSHLAGWRSSTPTAGEYAALVRQPDQFACDLLRVIACRDGAWSSTSTNGPPW